MKNEPAKKFWPPLPKEEFFKIILSFIFLVLAGSILNFIFQQDSWTRQAKFELAKTELDNDRQIASGLSPLIDERLFTAQQVIEAIKDNNQNEINNAWSAYMEAVSKWNTNSSGYQAKLDLAFNYDIGGQLQADIDDLNNEIPNSIHYKFVKIHQNLLSLKSCFNSGCEKQSYLAKLSKLIVSLLTLLT